MCDVGMNKLLTSSKTQPRIAQSPEMQAKAKEFNLDVRGKGAVDELAKIFCFFLKFPRGLTEIFKFKN